LNALNEKEVFKLHDNIKFMKPLGFFEYNKLQQNALCVISDSGTITEESHYLQFPGITTRNAHERPEGMDVGKVIMSGLTPERIYDSVNLAIKLHDKQSRPIEHYSNDNVSAQVVKIIQSYTGYINRTVWSKGSQNV
jgi:UDP-N-acetylglucosamine 2-epimerase (non-hydrolysing)